MRHFCYTFVTLSFSTLATLFLHNIGNQKCATFVSLWLHFPFPHLHSTSGTLSYTILVIKNAQHLLHFGYTLSYTYIPHLVHYIGNQKCITSAALSLYSACPNFHYTFPKLPLHHPQSLP